MFKSLKKLKLNIFFILIFIYASTTIFALILPHESFEKDMLATKMNEKIPPNISKLYKAIINSDFETIDYLLNNKKIDLSQNIYEIGNILHIATYYNNLKTLEYLLTKHYDEVYTLIDTKNQKGITPLMLASYLGNGHIIAFLLSKGANIDAKDSYGKRAMHWAAIGKQSLSIEILTYLGADINAIDNTNLRAVDYLKTNHDKESKKIIDLLNELSLQNEKLKYAPPLYTYAPLENLIFRGGGAKGIAYVGAIKMLEKLDALRDFKRVSGSSVGAITAVFLAVGYSSNEMLEILYKTDLTNFLDYYISEEKIKEFFENNTIGQILKDIADAFSQMLKHPEESFENTLELFKSIFDTNSLCEGEFFRKWIETKIYEKTNIHYLTFKELRNLTEIHNKFKHLHIFTTMVDPYLGIVQMNSEDRAYDDVIISDAVRASMSIPGVFKPHNLYIKNAKNKRVLSKDLGLFIDGGVLDNFPINSFDTLQYQKSDCTNEDKDFVILNKRTLGLTLYNPQKNQQISNELDNIYDLGTTIIELYFYAENLLRQLEAYDTFRTIKIDDKGVSTLEFNLPDKIKKELVTSGEKATRKFFDAQKKRLEEMDLIIDPSTIDSHIVNN